MVEPLGSEVREHSFHRFLPGVILAMGMALGLTVVTWFVCDDAFIGFRYAKHMAQGHGLRFNLGSAPPVEGFSHLLWVLIAAGVEGLGARSPDVMPWLSVLSAAGVMWAIDGHLMRRNVPDELRVWAAFATGLNAVFVVWGTSGLATMPHVLLCVLLFRAVQEHWSWRATAVVLLALCLIRTEGPFWALLILLGSGWTVVPPRRVAAGVMWVLAIGGMLTLWRWSAFGSVMANTVTAKVDLSAASLERGLAYVALWALTMGAPLLLGGVAILKRVAGKGLWIWVLGGLLFSVVSGGDYMPFFRFLLVVWPPFVLLGVNATLDMPTGRRRALFAFTVGLGLLPLVEVHVVPARLLNALHQVVGSKTAAFTSQRQLLDKERQKLPRRTARARAVAAVTTPGDRLLAKGVGVLGYETELVILDRYGLVSREVAMHDAAPSLRAPGHDRLVSRSFFWEMEPDWWLAEPLFERGAGEVLQLLPHQWALFEAVGPTILVAELALPPQDGDRWTPRQLLMVRPLQKGEDANQLRAAFKRDVRAAGYKVPRLEPLDPRRRARAAERLGSDYDPSESTD